MMMIRSSWNVIVVVVVVLATVVFLFAFIDQSYTTNNSWMESRAVITTTINNNRKLRLFEPETVVSKEHNNCDNKNNNIFQNSYEGNYEKWVDDIERMMKCTDKREVLMGMCSKEYAWRFDEFIDITARQGFPSAQLAMVSFDQATHAYFTLHNVPSLLLKSESTSDTYKYVKESKTKAPLMFLRKGWTVYFSEMDIFWRSTPKLNFPAKEFIVSQHNYHPEMNIGFYAVRSTSNTIALFERLLSYLDEDKVHPVLNKDDPLCHHDQKLMDVAVRGVSDQQNVWLLSDMGVQHCCNGLNRDQCANILVEKLVPSKPIQWEYLPYDIMPHYPLSGTISDEKLRNPGMAGIHMFGLISVQERSQWLRDHWLSGAGNILKGNDSQ